MTAAPSPAPRSAMAWLGDRSVASLAAIQAFIGLEFLAYAWLRPVSGSVTAAAAAFGMLALAVLTLIVIRWSTGVTLRVLLNVSLALSWLTVAMVTASRYTPQGQVALGMSVLILAVWASYALPLRSVMVQTVAMVIAYDAVLLLVDPPVDVFFAFVATTVILGVALLITRLRVVDARYRLLVENSADIVFHTSGGILVWVSPSIGDLLGWTPEVLVGRPTTHLWHPDDLERAVALRDQVYGARQARRPSACGLGTADTSGSTWPCTRMSMPVATRGRSAPSMTSPPGWTPSAPSRKRWSSSRY